ncbi:hypothetical protein ACI65C_013540 [Semiaphis heraclei]
MKLIRDNFFLLILKLVKIPIYKQCDVFIIMWSIVEFIDEHTIEVVPDHWVKNKKCAWPKQKTLQIAKAKLKKAEHTSDLSTTEEVCIREKKTKIPDPPMYSSHNIMETSNVQKDHDSNNFETQSFKNVSLTKPCKRKLFDSIISDVLSLQNTPKISNKLNTQYENSAEKYFTVTDSNIKQSIVYTSSSPFKVTSEINVDYASNNMMNELKKSCIYAPGSRDINRRYTETYMYKEGSKPLQKDNMDKVTPLSTVRPTNLQSSIKYDTEIVIRILQVVLKIRYDVESLGQKLQQMDKKIEENGLLKTAANESTYIEIINQEDDFESMLPLMNEDDLNIFENKLSNRSFRLNVNKSKQNPKTSNLNFAMVNTPSTLNIDITQNASFKMFCVVNPQ